MPARSASSSDKPIYLLVIAHPDDESMFFVPTILTLLSSVTPSPRIHILSLSNGGYDGLGQIRSQELIRAARVLGLSEENLSVLDDERLKDGPGEIWEEDVVAGMVGDHVRRLVCGENVSDAGHSGTGGTDRDNKTKNRAPRPVVIINFDEGGVSGHPNHVDTSRGIRKIFIANEDKPQPKKGDEGHNGKDIVVCGWELHTISNSFLKYFPFCDLVYMLLCLLSRLFYFLLGWKPWDTVFSPPTNVSRLKSLTSFDVGIAITMRTFQPHVVWYAMAAHKSQFVWYRRLSVLFSRYTYVNYLKRGSTTVGLPASFEIAPAVATKADHDEVSFGRIEMSDVVFADSECDDIQSYPHILTHTQMKNLSYKALPPTVRLKRWKRLYSLLRDGDSFHIFIQKAGSAKGSLIVVQTKKGEIFGGYADAAWDEGRGKGFYGTGQGCLWRFAVASNSLDGNINVYKWTGANTFSQTCNIQKETIAFGGGGTGDGGTFGLFLGNNFSMGTTGRCDTFGNEPLCREERFDVVDLEVWGFVT